MSSLRLPRLSVVVPILDEQEVFPELRRRLAAVLDEIPGGPHEVLIVDDGSTDDTPSLIDVAATEDPRFRAVHLSRNFGHQAAITAGLDLATGDYVVTMDGDLQDPPEEIPRLLAKAQRGYDVVYARRIARKEGFVIRSAYFLAYRLIALLAEVEVPLDAGDFGIISKRVADGLRATPESQRFVRGLRAWQGFRQIGIEVERHERGAGEPKYTTRKLVRLALDGMFAFSIAPLRLAALAGFGALAVSSLYGLWSIYAKLVLDRSPQGFTGLISAIVFLAGVQLLFLGVIGEYVGRIYKEVKRRPTYVVDRILGVPLGPTATDDEPSPVDRPGAATSPTPGRSD